MTRTIRFAFLTTCLVLACSQRSGDTATPNDGASGSDTAASSGDGDTPTTGEDATASDVPPAVAELPQMPDAKPLGSKMWRRFGKGEWTGHTFFVPDAKAMSVTVVVDMEGGGETVPDPFDLVLETQDLTQIEGPAKVDGRVPPGMKRREQWKFKADHLGVARIRFVTMKGGEEKGGTTACLEFSANNVTRCKGSVAAEGQKDEPHKLTFCCAKGKNDKGENCEPIADDVDAMKACMKAKKFNLTCEHDAVCTDKGCTCKPAP